MVIIFSIFPISTLAEEAATSAIVWDGSIATDFSDGDGTYADPFQIANGAELARLSYVISNTATNPTYHEAYFILTADIDLGGNSNNFTPIGVSNANYQRFSGNFDGNGFVIRNLYINSPGITALFGMVRNAQISNVILIDPVVISASNHTGGLVGWSVTTGTENQGQRVTISNSAVINGVITQTGMSFTGGLVGQMSNTDIVESYAIAIVSGGAQVGGLIGNSSATSTINYSFARGSVSATTAASNAGGLIGQVGAAGTTTINYSYIDVDVTVTNTAAITLFSPVVGGGTGTVSANSTGNFYNSDAAITAGPGPSTPSTFNHRFTGKTAAELRSDDILPLLNASEVNFARLAYEHKHANGGFPFLTNTFIPIFEPTQLSAPESIIWNDTIATWGSVVNAVGYRVFLYKDGDAKAVAVVEVDCKTSEFDFADHIAVNGNGAYTFIVIALGDGYDYFSSVESSTSGIHTATGIVMQNVTFNVSLPYGTNEFFGSNDPIITVNIGSVPIRLEEGVARELPTGNGYTYTVEALGFVTAEGTFNITDTAVVKSITLELSNGWDGVSTIEPELYGAVYQITSGYELAWFRDRVNQSIANFDLNAVLLNDIDLGGFEWTPIADYAVGVAGLTVNSGYSGIFDGGGHTISGLNISTGLTGSGLFGILFTGGEIKNVTVEGDIVAGQYSGGIVGRSHAGGFVSNVQSLVDITALPSAANRNIMVGGIVGGMTGVAANAPNIIEHSINFGNITVGTTDSMVGGVIGNASTGPIIIRYSGNEGNITGRERVGGIAGQGSAFITDSYNTGSITGIGTAIEIGGISGFTNNTSNTGALAGFSNGIENSYNLGTVSGANRVGGIVGWMNNTTLANPPAIVNSYNAGNVSGTGTDVGAIIGLRQANVNIVSENNFYLEDSAGVYGKGIGNNAHYDDEVTLVTYIELKAPEMIDLLGAAFVFNENGFPILYWQIFDEIPVIHDPITVYISAGNNTGDGFLFARQEIAVTPGIAAQFGYANAATIAAGEITALDALVAAHVAIFGENMADVNAALVVNFGWLNRMFNLPAANSSIFVNGVQPNDGIFNLAFGSYTGYSLAQARLSEGDIVEFFFLQANWPESDTYAWFEVDDNRVENITVTEGESFTISLIGYPGMLGMHTATDRNAATAPIEGANIVAVNVSGNVGNFGTSLATTNTYGVAEITLNEPGTFILSAVQGTADAPIMSPWLVVTVTDKDRDPEIINVQFIDNMGNDTNILTNGGSISAVTLNLNRAAPVTVLVTVRNDNVFYSVGHRVFTTSGTLDFNVPLPADVSNAHVTVMLWNCFLTMHPLNNGLRIPKLQ